MASEIRVDKINSLSGVGTVTLSPTGVDIAGITTAATLRATTGIVTSLTAGSLTSLGAVSGTTGTFSAAVSGTTGTFSGAVSGTTGTFSGAVSGTTGTFTGDVDIADKIIHTGDTNTAIRFPAADTITAETGGSERFRITSAGKVGVNQSSPTDDLEVVGHIGTATTIFINSSTHNTNVANESMLKFGYGHSGSPDAVGHIKMLENGANAFDAHFIFSLPTNNGSGGSVTNEKMRIFSNGNVQLCNPSGVGNSNPAFSGSTVGGMVRIDGTTPTLYMRETDRDVGAQDFYIGRTSETVYVGNQGGDIVFQTSDNGASTTERCRIRYNSNGLAIGGTGDANTLYDYEEGSWTPDLNGGGSSTWTSKDGKYQKVGNTVTCWMRVDGGSNPRSGSSGHLTIYNIPFALTGDSNQVLGTCGANVDGASGQNFIVATSGSSNPFIRTGGQNTTGITVSFFTAVFTYNTTA